MKYHKEFLCIHNYMSSKKKGFTKDDFIKQITEHYNEFEKWIPNYDDKDVKNWKVVDGMDVKKYVGKKIVAEYTIDKKIIDDCEKIIKLKEQIDYNMKTPKLLNDLVLMLKIFNDKISLFAYVTCSMLTGIKNAIEFYLNGDQHAMLRPFGELKNANVRVQLVDIFVCKQPKKYMNVIRDEYIKKDKVCDVYQFYLNLFKQFENVNMELVEYFIYLFDDKKKKYLFYSENEVTEDNIDEYLEDIDIEFDSKKHKYKLLKKVNYMFKGQLFVEMDKLMNDFKLLDKKNYNEETFIVDLNFNMTKSAEIKKKIFVMAQHEKFEKMYEDNQQYSKIHQYIYQIKIGDKFFVDISDGDRSLRTIINDFYLGENIPTKYKQIVTAIRNANYEELHISLIKKKSKSMKMDLKSFMETYIKDNIMPSDLLNAKPTTVQKYKFGFQNKKAK